MDSTPGYAFGGPYRRDWSHGIAAFILLLLMFYGIVIVHFRPDANKAQVILTNLWSRRVSEMTPQRPPANTR